MTGVRYMGVWEDGLDDLLTLTDTYPKSQIGFETGKTMYPYFRQIG